MSLHYTVTNASLKHMHERIMISCSICDAEILLSCSDTHALLHGKGAYSLAWVPTIPVVVKLRSGAERSYRVRYASDIHSYRDGFRIDTFSGTKEFLTFADVEDMIIDGKSQADAFTAFLDSLTPPQEDR